MLRALAVVYTTRSELLGGTVTRSSTRPLRALYKIKIGFVLDPDTQS